jgi:gamma-glutamyltranspeptidase / glutathione hydrolase
MEEAYEAIADRSNVVPFPQTPLAKAGKPALAMGSSGLASRAVVQTARPESRVSEQARKELDSRHGATVISTMPTKRYFESIPASARAPNDTPLRIAGPRRAGIPIGH